MSPLSSSWVGFLMLCYIDETAKALPLFEKAIGVARAQFLEAVEGKMKCLEELQSPQAARSFLGQQANEGIVDVRALEDKLDE